ncbi:MAG: hypothetical protein OEU91_00215 [Gammaproteobacteria bacterium]|nr:hypothetical protein [Gammaproteobacteria bacterium]
MKTRTAKERRQLGKPASFPLTDRSGCVVPFNRSRQPERRMNNYVLNEIYVEEFTLTEAQPAQKLQ